MIENHWVVLENEHHNENKYQTFYFLCVNQFDEVKW